MVRPASSRSDAELLSVARTDGDAFRELYLRYEAIVAGFLQRRTGDAELTADLTAETFATAVLKGGRFSGEGSAAGWLLGIARNHHLHWLRRGRAETRARERLGIERVRLTDASLERIEHVLDPARPDSALATALAGLPDAQREAVLAVVLEERSCKELAGILGVQEATVRQRVSRGLAKLRVSIEGGRP